MSARAVVGADKPPTAPTDLSHGDKTTCRISSIVILEAVTGTGRNLLDEGLEERRRASVPTHVPRTTLLRVYNCRTNQTSTPRCSRKELMDNTVMMVQAVRQDQAVRAGIGSSGQRRSDR